MRDTELLEQTMQYILDHPEEHNQMLLSYHLTPGCGTPSCFMGWAAALSEMNKQIFREYGGLRQWAENRFDISASDFQKVFAESNTVEDLQLMVKQLVNGDEHVIHPRGLYE
jgi:hypothetical protein